LVKITIPFAVSEYLPLVHKALDEARWNQTRKSNSVQTCREFPKQQRKNASEKGRKTKELLEVVLSKEIAFSQGKVNSLLYLTRLIFSKDPPTKRHSILHNLLQTLHEGVKEIGVSNFIENAVLMRWMRA